MFELFGEPWKNTFRAVLVYMDDFGYMKRALRLAIKGTGKVSPNPRVGAVVVKNDIIIGEGYHERFGGPHAEASALSKLSYKDSRGSKLYVNLEPCCYFGKTPPCTDLIIKSGVSNVIIGTTDPNIRVKGKGIENLKKSGISVRVGILEKECVAINEAYFKYIVHKKPFITLKIAQTLDGNIATDQGLSRWITGEVSRRFVQKMRKLNDAVIVGVNTVISDNPELTVRYLSGYGVRRFIMDSKLRISLDSQVLKNVKLNPTTVATTDKANKQKIQILKDMSISVWILPENRYGNVAIKPLLIKMADQQICSVLVEGGRKVFTSFLKSGEVDRIYFLVASKLFGKGISVFGDLGVKSPGDAILLKDVSWKKIGMDMVVEGKL